MDFTKMTGTGNDFVVIDNRKGGIGDIATLAIEVCRRGTGVGADGILAVEESDKADFRMRIFNPDGSEAEMCGNGARCIAVYAHMLGMVGREMSFETLAGIIKGAITADGARVEMPKAALPEEITALEFFDTSADVFFINTGVPHVVMAVENVDVVPLRDWGRAIRTHQRFAPAGTNVNFISRRGDSSIRIRTYERGVEDETLACGTGATAAAITAGNIWQVSAPVRVATQSGEELTIDYQRCESAIENIFLSGPVRTVYEGRLS